MRPADDEAHRLIVASAPEGIVLVDAQDSAQPVVYVNAAFERLTGYAGAELVGRNLRLLQGEDSEQEGRALLREAIARGESCRVLMRNYRKDGTMFWNEISLVPLYGAQGRLTHYAGYHRDATERLKARAPEGEEARFPPLPPQVALRDDRLTGLYTFAYFTELLRRDWSLAQRDERSIAAIHVDIDALDLYNATFGRAAGDSAIRRVGHCVGGCVRRSSDALARAEGGRQHANAPGGDGAQALRVGQKIVDRVGELRIHHPRSTIRRYVTVSVGVAAAVPGPGEEPESLLERARERLMVAKATGRNRVA